MQTNQPETTNNGTSNRRDFIKRYGKYAAATPVAMTTLMTPGKASAACSEGSRQCKKDCNRLYSYSVRECMSESGYTSTSCKSFTGQQKQDCKDTQNACKADPKLAEEITCKNGCDDICTPGT